jgi:hypothetical protein
MTTPTAKPQPPVAAGLQRAARRTASRPAGVPCPASRHVLVVDPVEKVVHHESVRAQELDEPAIAASCPTRAGPANNSRGDSGGPVTLSARICP